MYQVVRNVGGLCVVNLFRTRVNIYKMRDDVLTHLEPQPRFGDKLLEI